jgi:hypothetical protein
LDVIVLEFEILRNRSIQFCIWMHTNIELVFLASCTVANHHNSGRDSPMVGGRGAAVRLYGGDAWGSSRMEEEEEPHDSPA